MAKFEKLFEIGNVKFDYYRCSKPVVIKVCLREDDGKSVFSASALIKNHNKIGCCGGGQCLDEIAKQCNDPLFTEIYRLWKLYHLNDMHSGTIEQEAAIDEWKKQGNRYDYTKACEYLKSIGLYEVEHEGEPYRYGHAWLYQEIPADDLEKIRTLLQ